MIDFYQCSQKQGMLPNAENKKDGVVVAFSLSGIKDFGGRLESR